MTTAIVGASGVLARHLLPRLRGPMRAVVRRPEAAGMALACGAEVRVADVFDAAALRAALEGCDTVVNVATSLPGPSGRGDYAANDRLRRDGTAVLIDVCRAVGVRRLLQQSIAMVNARGEAWADEDSPYTPAGNAVADDAVHAALAMEASVRASGLDWLILRGALFYGPGTGFDDDWFQRAAAGKLRLPGDGSAYVSLVHVADMASAIEVALAAWPSAHTLIVADEAPPRWRELFEWIATAAGGPPPTPGGRLGFSSFRVSSERLRRTLPWRPAHPTHRTGLAR